MGRNQRESLMMRYHNDAKFHALCNALAEAMYRKDIERSDIFDAIQVADQIVYERELENKA